MEKNGIGWESTKKERRRFAVAGAALALIGFIIGSYFMQYMSEVLLIDIGIAGLIVGLMQAFDAVIDPFVGILTDRTKSRWGKSKPYLMFMPVPLVLVSVMIFSPLKAGAPATLWLVVLFYVLFAITYTMYDIPFWSMSSLMIRDAQLKVNTISLTKMLSNMLGPVAIVLFINLVSILKPSVGSTQNGYFIAMLIFMAIVLPLLLIGGFSSHERVKTAATGNVSVRASIKHVFTSRPMIINILAGLFACVSGIGSIAMSTYFIKWNLWKLVATGESPLVNALAGNAVDPVAVQGVFTFVIGLLPTVAAVVGLALTPLLARRFAKKDVIFVSGMLGGLLNIAAYFIGYQNLILFIIFRFIVFIPMGIFNGMFAASFTDTIDYIHYKSGIRAEGLSFSMLTFLSKFTASIASVLAGILLSWTGYQKDLQVDIDAILATVPKGALPSAAVVAATRAIQQPDSVLTGIFLMATVAMGVGQILVAVPYLFSNLTKAKLGEVKTFIDSQQTEEPDHE